MSLETLGLCKLVHKKSDFYESSSRSNEPISEPSENIVNRKNKSTSGQLVPLVCLQSNRANSSLRSRERATLLLSKYISDARDSLKILKNQPFQFTLGVFT